MLCSEKEDGRAIEVTAADAVKTHQRWKSVLTEKETYQLDARPGHYDSKTRSDDLVVNMDEEPVPAATWLELPKPD
jgi:hypothetical protein